MDGRGRWVENALAERLGRSVKYVALYLHARDTLSEANTVLERYFDFCNARRPRRGLGDLTPDEVYLGKPK
jgi:putative transposase